jgi:thiol:disulfide interchange protein DsbD
MKEISFVLLLSLCFATLSFGQIENPVAWTVDAEVSDDVVTLTYTAAIDKGWYVYSQHLESDMGPIPTSINLESADLKTIGEIKEIGDKKEGYDELFDMNIIKYAGSLVLVQQVERSADLKNIKGYIEFMTCDNSRCLPPAIIDFDINVN